MKALLLAFLLLFPINAHAINVLGAQAGYAFPTCGSFAMVDLGTYNYPGDPNTFTQLALSSSNIYYGVGNGLLGVNRDLYTFNANSNINIGISGSVPNVDAANNPDNQNTQAASHYNSTVDYFVNIGAQAIAPCGGTPCFHARFYRGTTFMGGVTLAALAVIGTQRFVIAGDKVYINYNMSTGTRLMRMPNTYDVSEYNVPIDPLQNISGLAYSGGFVYATFLPNIVKRWNADLTGLVNYTMPFSSILLSGPFIDEENGWMYVGHNSGVTHQLHRFNISDPTVSIAQVNFGPNENVSGVNIDFVYNKLYVFLSDNGTTARIVRLDRTTLATEATYNGPNTVNGPQSIQYNFQRQRAYINMLGGGGNINAINEVRLCIFN